MNSNASAPSDPSASPVRSVLVTGSSTGIGRAIALRLARAGWRVFACVRREEDGASLVASFDGSERAGSGDATGSVRPLILDVTDAAQIARAVAEVDAVAGSAGLQGLVNNAGIVVGAPLEFIPPDALRRQIEVNLVAPILVASAFLPAIRVGSGRIVAVGSIDGKVALPFMGAYGATKHGMEAVTDALRMELSPWGIHVAIVDPGNIATPIWEKSMSDAERMERDLPERARALYGPVIAKVKVAARKMAAAGADPDVVARDVEHALTARRPRTRYYPGGDARIRAVLRRVLPDRWMDRLILGELTR